jgi:hypothetical protein
LESEVFAYFVSIGAGLSLGVTLGALPAIFGYQFMKRRANANGAYQTKKQRA